MTVKTADDCDHDQISSFTNHKYKEESAATKQDSIRGVFSIMCPSIQSLQANIVPQPHQGLFDTDEKVGQSP